MSNKRNKYKAKILKQQEIRKVTANENTCVTISSAGEDTMKKFTFKLPRHLSYWNNNLHINTFKSWCGDWTTPFKQETREYVIKNNYKSILDVGAGLYSGIMGHISDGKLWDIYMSDKYKPWRDHHKEDGPKEGFCKTCRDSSHI